MQTKLSLQESISVYLILLDRTVFPLAPAVFTTVSNDYECDMSLTFPMTSRDNGKSKS